MDKPSSILLIGSGPIVIGQACEFDYSGVQAIKALKEEGIRVIVVNNNPATYMTEKNIADVVYCEPLAPWAITRIIEKERPSALISTMGGQTALNISMELYKRGILEKYNVKLLGASVTAINTAEDREEFSKAMKEIGLETSRSFLAHNLDEGIEKLREVGLPCILRPSFTLGGAGGGIAYDMEDFKKILDGGLKESPVHSVLIEESLIGWKEFELEVVRDKKDNCIVVCSIENIDPMGIHTGDSITVAPAMTLTDKEYQKMRDAAFAVIRRVGVETGGSNIQFAIHPETGRMVVVEMNPRVSRSSALASKATGYPIARVATKLALGYTLDNLPNAITKNTSASFEPSIDYIAVKIPRWCFDKFKDAEMELSTHMKSIGEVMALGRTFPEALNKAIRSLEIDRYGILDNIKTGISYPALLENLRKPRWERLFYVALAFNFGLPIEEIRDITSIDIWFLRQVKEIVEMNNRLGFFSDNSLPSSLLKMAKGMGFSDREIAAKVGCIEEKIREYREDEGIHPSFKGVDTCACEFEAKTPYFYSSYEDYSDGKPLGNKSIMIIGSGPNRIGQGLEFDTCCCQAIEGLRLEGFNPILYNCNPETVSTDFDTADRLYFEPVTTEDVLSVIKREDVFGVILTLGGQTPLKIASGIEKEGVRILGTGTSSIFMAEDRGAFRNICIRLGLCYANGNVVSSEEDLYLLIKNLGYPVIIRPSFVIGGQGMEVVYGKEGLERYINQIRDISNENALLVEEFLGGAREYDVDAICDGKEVLICGILEHIEKAGIHSGDSMQVFPPQMTPNAILNEMEEITKRIAIELKVKGLLNIQFAVKDKKIYVLEANPRASRTIPFLSKARGIAFASLAARVMVGRSLNEIWTGQKWNENCKRAFVKAPVFPFSRLAGADPILGPEMKSTGEVMGVAETFGEALAKAFRGAGNRLPEEGTVFISIKDEDKSAILSAIKELYKMEFKIVATSKTSVFLKENGIRVDEVYKIGEGTPTAGDLLSSGAVNLILNTPSGIKAERDASSIRMLALKFGIPCITTVEGAFAAVEGIRALRSSALTVSPLY